MATGRGKTGTAAEPEVVAVPLPETAGHDTARAIRNAGILTIGLLGTWSVALAVRLFLPRMLGPEAFGALHFADYFAQGFLIVTALGVDTYIRKEVATRPSHASDFFGGMLLVRLLVGLCLSLLMLLVLSVTGRGPEVRTLVLLYAAAHFLLTLNHSYGALLQARGTVTGLALVNFVTKAGWGVAVIVGLLAGAPLLLVPAAFIAAEFVKTGALFVLARRHLSLRLHIDRKATIAVMVVSLPFFVNILAQTLYDKIDVSMIGILAGNTEAGYYGAATILTAAALMLTPIINSVLLPHSSRAAARSPEDLQRVMEGALRIIFVVILPIAFVLIAGAELWVSFLFGADFAPSVPALRVRAANLVLTYMATLSAIHLIQLGRFWTVTLISLAALAFNPTMNYFLIQVGMRHLGAGGAGSGAAIASLTCEMMVVTLMQIAAGKRSLVLATAGRLLRGFGALAVVAALFIVLEPIGQARLLVCVAIWVPVGLATRAMDVGDIRTFMQAIFTRGRRRRS